MFDDMGIWAFCVPGVNLRHSPLCARSINPSLPGWACACHRAKGAFCPVAREGGELDVAADDADLQLGGQ